jgi:hypothetical protein
MSIFCCGVRAYFGYAGGFTSLFENAETFDVSGGTSFSSATLMELLDRRIYQVRYYFVSRREFAACRRYNIFNNHSRTQHVNGYHESNNMALGQVYHAGRYDMDSEWYSG